MKRRLLAGLLVAAGATMSLGALIGFATARSQPPERLLHADPHPGAAGLGTGGVGTDPAAALVAISRYAAGVPEEPAPVQPRQGMWIEVPALKIALPVREGDGSDRIPQWVALHYPGTAAPGAPGNSYLYAHGLWGMFGGLLFAKVGDRVDLHDYSTGAVRTMHVSRVVGRTRWNDTSWIHEQTAAPTLTLQTCVDLDAHGDRYVVQAS